VKYPSERIDIAPMESIRESSAGVPGRKAYGKPELAELGNIRELTRTGGDASVEWGG